MSGSSLSPTTQVLITAGPTHEPIDAVRYLANRSSGRMGLALAAAALHRGWAVTVLLGPSVDSPLDPRLDVRRFRTSLDLQRLLDETFPACDVLIMAAAVADFRPAQPPQPGKLPRSHRGLTLQLEPTPDLLARCAEHRRTGQTLVGFALEPRDRLLADARAKLVRKGLDLIVANPLETMGSDIVEAVVLTAGGRESATPGPMPKSDFAPWLLDLIVAWRQQRGLASPRQPAPTRR